MIATPSMIEKAIENAGILVNNYQTIDSLRSAMASGDHAFVGVPTFLEELFEEEGWRDCLDHNGNRHTFGANGFADFVTSPPPHGLGATIDEVRRYLGDSGNPLRIEFEKRVTRSAGGNRNPYGANQYSSGNEVIPNSIRDDLVETQSDSRERDRSREPQAGTSVGYAVRRLSRERPDLLAKIENGEISANAAMLEAGFRKPTITLPVDPESAVRLIVKHFKGEALETLVRGLANWSGMEVHPSPEHEPR